METKSLKKQLIAAIAMVLVALLALGSSTYAWFTMNNVVEAKGMNVNATTDASLVIKGEKEETYTSVGTNAINVATLKPATSFDGVNFGVINTAKDNKVKSAGNSTVTWSNNVFESNDLVTGAKDTNYIESIYSIKAIAEDRDVVVKGITITSENADLKKAIRVSIKMGENEAKVFSVTGGTNASEGVGKLEGSAWSLTAANYATVDTDAANIGSLTADNAQNVVVRVWFEGQDTECYSDNVSSKGYDISVDFKSVKK